MAAVIQFEYRNLAKRETLHELGCPQGYRRRLNGKLQPLLVYLHTDSRRIGGVVQIEEFHQASRC